MSIQSEINRITLSRDNSFVAVRSKGVTVPSNAVINDLPTYIGQIISASEIPYYNGEIASPGHAVQISLTNPINGSAFYSCKIYSASSSDDYSSDDKIGEIATASGNTTVNAQGYGLCVFLDGMSVDVPQNGIICTSGISYIGFSYLYGTWLFEVTSDGSITLNNVDYDG